MARHRVAAGPGKRAVVLTGSVCGYSLARQLRQSGVSVVALVDRRGHPGADLVVLSHRTVLEGGAAPGCSR